MVLDEILQIWHGSQVVAVMVLEICEEDLVVKTLTALTLCSYTSNNIGSGGLL